MFNAVLRPKTEPIVTASLKRSINSFFAAVSDSRNEVFKRTGTAEAEV